MKVKVVFIILHYLATDMTKECVETLLNSFREYNDKKIIVVDNASPNGSGQALQEFFADNQHVDIILNKENLGFAKGNNVGYVYAKEKYNSDYIIILNNDVLINDSQFLDKAEKLYLQYHYAVLGPDIFASKINFHQNPAHLNGFTYEEMKKLIRKTKTTLRFCAVRSFLHKVKYSLKIFKRKKLQKQDDYYKETVIKNPVLHGACYIFSRDFIENEELAFNQNTFMYFEEDILHYYCMKKGYLMLYSSDLQVVHLDDVSTDIAFSSNYKKSKMKNKNMLDSEIVLLKMMEQDGAK